MRGGRWDERIIKGAVRRIWAGVRGRIQIIPTFILTLIHPTDVPISQPRRQRRHRPEPQPEEPEQNPDDIVDISYVGSNIPSRSFKVLQHAVGEHEMNQPGKLIV